MPETRSLTYILELIDNATKPLKDASKIADDLDKSISKVTVSADTSGATKSLSTLAGVGEEVGSKLQKAGDQAAQAGARIKEVWDPATQSIIRLREEAEKTETQLDKLKGGLNNVTSAIGGYKTELLAIQVATGGLLTMSIKSAAEEERLAGAVKAVFGDSAEEVLKWADAANQVTGAIDDERMEMALLFKEMGQGTDESMRSAEVVEKFWRNTALRQRAQAAGITSRQQLTQEIRMAEVGGRTYGLRRILGKEAMENIGEYGGAEKVLSLLNKEVEKTGATGMDAQKAMGDFREVVTELAHEIGTVLLPPITAIFQILTKVIILLKNIPGAPQIIALGSAFAFLTAGGILLVGTLSSGILSIIKLAEGIGKLSLMTKVHTALTYAWAAAQAVANGITKVLAVSVGLLTNAFKVLKATMMANPWIAAFTILLGVVIALEAKFHIFEKIFEKLSKIDWAGKMAGGLESLSKLWGGLTGKLGSMAKPVLAVTMPGITVMAVLLKSMFELSKPFIEMATPAIKYIKDIYDIIKEKFESAIKYLQDMIPDWLKSIFDAIGSFITWITEKINILLSILGIREKTAEEKEEEEKVAGMTAEERLAYNQTKYAIEQASGGERGLPTVGAGNLPGWTPAFGGKYAGTTFTSTRYPGQERLGRDLTEAQLMTGEWAPTSGAEEFKGFIESQKKAQEEAQKETAEGEKEYTSIFDSIYKIAKDIYDAVVSIYEWFKNTLIKPLQDIASKLGIGGEGGGEGVPESEMQPALKDYLQQKRIEGGYTPYSDVDLQWLVDYVTGKKVSKKPSTITEIDIKMAKQAYENLKSGAVPRATTSTGTNLAAPVNPETGEISGGQPQTPEEVAASVNNSPASGEPQVKINEPTLQEKIRDQGTSGTVTSNYAPLMPMQTGGIVEETGAALIHKGEEVIAPKDVQAIKENSIPSILQGLNSIFYHMKTIISNYIPFMHMQTGGTIERAESQLIREGVISPENISTIKESLESVMQGKETKTQLIREGVISPENISTIKEGLESVMQGKETKTPLICEGVISPENISAIKESLESVMQGKETKTQLIREGEEVAPAKDIEAIRDGSTSSILQDIDSLVYRMSGKTLQPVSLEEPVVNMNFYAPVVKVEKISSEMDLYKIKSDLVAFLRKEVKSAMKGGM